MLTDCIECSGGRNQGGYGHCRFEGKNMLAHRAAWTRKNGPILGGLHVLHHCDNPACINVDHLYLGTDLDNARDRDSRGRRRAPAGSMNGRAQISEFTAVRIKMLKGVLKIRDVAECLNLKKSQVANIMNGDSWKHVTANTRCVI